MASQIIGKSPPIEEMLSLIKRVAGTKTNILVTGESGTGKELVARMIHDSGPLKGRPFIPVNCGAIPENLIESEMFGHKKGSFTGAVSDTQGLFEAANGGTLFLDEVGELPFPMQVKLLRAIQERSFRKVGGTEDIRVELRIIAATNRDLEKAIAEGKFREDLYYRLNVIHIRTPSLRERRGDIAILAEHFLKKFATKFGKEIQTFDADAIQALESYDWPGNVRELENVIERSIALEHGTKLARSSLPLGIAEKVEETSGAKDNRGKKSGDSKQADSGEGAREIRIPLPDFSKGPVDLDEVLGSIEKKYLLLALDHCKGVKKKAAKSLGITFRSIRYRLKKLGVKTPEEKKSRS